MKRFVMMALMAVGLASAIDSRADADTPVGLGRCRRVGRVEGYWMNPTRGPLYDYSSYFATLYPYLPGAQEYQWQATTPGAFGTGVAVLPTSPPYPVQHPPRVIEVRPAPTTGAPNTLPPSPSTTPR